MTVASDKLRLVALKDELAAARSSQAALLAERKTIHRRLMKAGVPRAECARLSGVSDMAVEFAVNGKRKRSESPAP